MKRDFTPAENIVDLITGDLVHMFDDLGTQLEGIILTVYNRATKALRCFSLTDNISESTAQIQL